MAPTFFQHRLADPQWLRLAATALALGILLAGEAPWPRRAARRRQRWAANIALLMFSALLLALLPVASLGVAAWAQAHGLGLLSAWRPPRGAEIALSVVALDLAMYWNHRLMHGPDWLWRLHRVHHSDVEFDATTALRFHPFELLAALLWKWAAIVLLGASPLAVLVYESIAGVYALFVHANLHLPARLDRALRPLFVTPDLHRVHHSTAFDEGNCNFGTIFSCWDRCFRSHRAQPRQPHAAMPIGLDHFRDAEAQRLRAMLVQPWRAP
ncbi:sterol desaturase family protein [Solimonas soli]|uniref:sterol desaturase family protein n=1 Tax=Solimonas soli TaxID=413479 RepID=UPI000484D5DD|nr:sterol desaturase family protein [Solimonas soli]